MQEKKEKRYQMGATEVAAMRVSPGSIIDQWLSCCCYSSPQLGSIFFCALSVSYAGEIECLSRRTMASTWNLHASCLTRRSRIQENKTKKGDSYVR